MFAEKIDYVDIHYSRTYMNLYKYIVLYEGAKLRSPW